MSELSKEQQSHLDNLLDLQALCREKITEYGKREGIKSADPSDVASEVESQHTKEANRQHELKRLKRIQFAIENIEEFPYCMECGDEIPARRFEVEPATTECVDCKEVSEKKLRRMA